MINGGQLNNIGGIISINGNTTPSQMIVAGVGITVDSPEPGTTRIINTATGGINEITSSDNSLYITNSTGPLTDIIINSISIRNTLLTGLPIINAALVDTDSILIGLGKAQGQINALSINSITSVFGRSGPSITAQVGDYNVGQITGAAPLNSPIFSGTPKAPTQLQGDNSTNLATTAYVDTGLNLKANIASPSFTGIPTAPTATPGTSSTQIATTAFVSAATAAGVTSFNTRTGAVISQTGDYSFNQISGTAAATQGGTGLNTYTTGDLLFAISSTNLGTLPATTIGKFVISNGVGQPPIYSNNPSISQITFTNLTAPIILQGAAGNATILTNGLTGNVSFTIPNANSNPIVPSTGAINQFATGINSSGIIQYGTPTNLLSTSTNTITSTVAGVVANASIINSNALSLNTTSLVSTVNGVSSTAVQVTPSGQSISSSISFTNLDERVLLVAPSVNAIGTYILQLKGINQELNIVFSINGNSTSFYNYSTINIIEVTDTTGNIKISNISNFILFRGYVRNNTPNSYFAVTFSMPQQLIYTNPLTMTVWQNSASYLNENTTITSLITGDISALITTASADLIFKMKVNIVPVSSSIPQGYIYLPGSSSNAIFQYSLNQTTGILTALTPASVAMTGVYKLTATTLRNYVYAINSSNIFMFRVTAGTGILTALTPASIATTNTPTGIAIDPTDRFLYVCGFGTGLFGQYLITKSTGQLTAIPSAPTAAGGMQDIAIHPSGKFLYAINNINGLIYQYSINPSTGALTALSTPSIAAGTGPVKIEIHPSGLYAYVLNNGSTNISQYSINPSTGLLTVLTPATFTVGGNPFGLAISSNGLFIYYTSQGAGSVSVSAINQTTGQIGTTLSSRSIVGARVCCFDFSGNYLFVVNNTINQIAQLIINQSTGAITTNGTIGTGTNANNIIAI